MPRYKLTLEYNGSGLAGWQRTKDLPSVQGELEKAFTAFCGEAVEVVGAGRTDAGVHARGQAAHVDLQREQQPYTIMSALNYHLLMQTQGEHIPLYHRIAVLSAEAVENDFHARFSATARHYVYRILNRRPPPALDAERVWHVGEALNAEAMQEAAHLLVGHHDFSSFRDAQCQAKSPLKTLDRLEVVTDGEEIRIFVSARSFLHHQVRNMAGSLKLVGNGKWRPADMKRVLELRDRSAAGPTAPAHGLCLLRVDY